MFRMPERRRRNFCSENRPSQMLPTRSSRRLRSTIQSRAILSPSSPWRGRKVGSWSWATQKMSPSGRERTMCSVPRFDSWVEMCFRPSTSVVRISRLSRTRRMVKEPGGTIIGVNVGIDSVGFDGPGRGLEVVDVGLWKTLDLSFVR